MKIYSHQIFALIIILVSNIVIILLVIIQREEQDIIDIILNFNEELIPNNGESNEISRSSFMPIKSAFNKMKINIANNQIDLEIEKIEKKNSKK